MALLAATATTTASSTPATLLILIVVTFGYLGMCAIWPYRACRHCRGYGRFVGPFHGIRLCPRCNGTGLQLRFGRRVFNAYRRLHRHSRRYRRNNHR